MGEWGNGRKWKGGGGKGKGGGGKGRGKGRGGGGLWSVVLSLRFGDRGKRAGKGLIGSLFFWSYVCMKDYCWEQHDWFYAFAPSLASLPPVPVLLDLC